MSWSGTSPPYQGPTMRSCLKSAALVLLCHVAISPAMAQSVFANGFETPCDLSDIDGDRLSGCQAKQYNTDPTGFDTDGDGLGDGDEVLGTVAGLNLPGMGAKPGRKDILI